MEHPPGMTGVTKYDGLLLLMCIYELFQAARQYHKKMVIPLRNIGLTGDTTDPCLFARSNKDGLCMMALYVDNNLMIRHQNAIDITIKELKAEGLNLTIDDEFNDYLSCMIKLAKNRKG